MKYVSQTAAHIIASGRDAGFPVVLLNWAYSSFRFAEVPSPILTSIDLMS